MSEIVVIDYTNWRGVRSLRKIRPIKITFEASRFHPNEQWLMDAIDIEKQEQRWFALSGIHSWKAEKDAREAGADLSERQDAVATVRGEIRDAIASTAHLTGMAPGGKTEILVAALEAKLKDPAVRWAFQVYAEGRIE